MAVEQLENEHKAEHNEGNGGGNKKGGEAVSEHTLFQSAFGPFQLSRYPRRKDENLRAWDAADEYLLRYIEESRLLASASSLLLINDSFGGLSIPLSSAAVSSARELKPVVMTDSYISVRAISDNLDANQVSQDSVSIISSLDDLAEYCDGCFSLIVIKVPRSLALLEDQLHRLRAVIDKNSIVIAAGMTKNIHSSTLSLFENIIGQTKTSHAQKKARLIFSTFDADLHVADNPYPKTYTLPYQLDGQEIQLSNHAAVFSQGKLDIGSRFLIENIPQGEQYKSIVDLGCGNGVIGLIAAIKNPQASLIFTDESFMAVESAITNFVAMFDDTREAEFLQTDCLAGIDENSVSLILCNPPFHQSNTITDEIAWQMFTESKAVLAAGGELWVVGNRHLAYYAKLKHLFGQCEVVASNKKFSILKATKS